LLLLVAGINVVAFIQTVAGILAVASCYCCCPLVPDGFPVAGLPSIAGVPGVVGVSAIPHNHPVSGGPTVTGFSDADGILVVASVPADPGIPILAGGFTYWTVQ
jgi:hypothetical protein